MASKKSLYVRVLHLLPACLLVGLTAADCAAQNPPLPPTDRFGGFTGIERAATGHFRTEKIAGRWSLITPQGHPYLALGANHIGKFFQDEQQHGPLLVRTGGDTTAAIEHIFTRMRQMSLTAGEAYVPLQAEYTSRMPYVASVGYPNGERVRFDVFDSGFRAAVAESVAAACTPIAGDSMVLGVAFIDLPDWGRRRVDFYRQLPATAAGKQRYLRFLQERYATVSEMNDRYETDFAAFEAIDTIEASTEQLVADDEAFLGMVADSLYALLKREVARSAPGKLFFGERFVLRMAPEAVLRSVGKHVDVFCTQALILSPQRPPEWQLFQREAYEEQRAHVGDLPVLIIDWAAPFSLDSTYTTDRGDVFDERQASRQAAHWLKQVCALPYIVGVFKCQFIGTHPNDGWFPAGRMKRTYLRDDGTDFAERTDITTEAHRAVLRAFRDSLTAD